MAKSVEAFQPTPRDPFPGGAHPLDWRRSGLITIAKKICRAYAEAALADEDAAGNLIPPSGAVLDRIVKKTDLWIGSGSFQLAAGFTALALAIESLPIAVIRSPKRMSSLSLSDRIRYLEKLEESENGLFTMLSVAFKVPLAASAFEEGELLRDTGFDREDLMTRTKLVRGKSNAGGER